LSGALRMLSNIRIRNVATLGGHLAHGDPHMDLPPILMTLGARISAVSRRGRRSIDIRDLFTGYYQTSLTKDELITGDAIGLVGRVQAIAGLELSEPGPGQTEIRYSSNVSLTGKLGGLGEPVFRAKSAEVAKQFGTNLKAAIDRIPTKAQT